VPENPRLIKLSVTDFVDTICHGCCAANAGGVSVENPKMCCDKRRNGEYCSVVIKIGTLVCKRTSLENLTNFEEF
jgi:hypothetical protein